MEAAAAAASTALDLEASPVQGQLASAVLDLQGNLVRGSLPTAPILFEMLAEAGSLLTTKSSFRRLTVSFSDTRYVVSRDEHHVYMVQTKAGAGGL